MAFEIAKVKYSGKINPLVLGAATKATVGGETAYAFMDFEGDIPNPPKIAMEVWDIDPGEEWPEAAKAAFGGVLGDPGAWAKKCVESGADIIVVQLKGTDPNGADKGPADAVAAVEKVLGAVDVPVFVYGVANPQKDTETLSAVAEKFQGKNLVLGPVEEKNHKQIGAQALAYGHVVAANTPIDVNLAKQLNILLSNLGLSNEKILIDPTTGGLGYGMEYCYSVMERIRMAALVQEDENLQQPIVNNMAQEVWKSKEAKLSLDEAPTLGFAVDRAVLMEVTEAVSLLLAGSDVLILRHPETVKIVKKYIKSMLEGGAVDVADLKQVETVPSDKLPKVEFTPSGPPAKEKKAAPAKPAAAAAPAKPAAAAAPAKPAAAAAPAKPAAAAAPAEPAKEAAVDPAKVQAEAEAKAKAEAEAKVKAEAEVKAKAEAEAKAKAEAEAKAKADAEAAAKAKAEEAAKAKAAEEEKLLALRAERAKEREEMEAKRLAEAECGPREMKKADVVVDPQMIVVDQIMASLQRVHMRVKKY